MKTKTDISFRTFNDHGRILPEDEKPGAKLRTPRKPKVKTLDITAKEWFDRVNGNSYFSLQVTINYQMKNEVCFSVPMQYGYGDQYKYGALDELVKRGYLPNPPKRTVFWRYYKENNIIARHTKYENCKKRELNQS